MHTNKENLPAPLCSVIDHFTNGHSKTMGTANISVTQLIDAPLVRLLRMKFADKIVTDYSEHLWPMFGSIAGYVLEHANERERHPLEDVQEPSIRGIDDLHPASLCKSLQVSVPRPELLDAPRVRIVGDLAQVGA